MTQPDAIERSIRTLQDAFCALQRLRPGLANEANAEDGLCGFEAKERHSAMLAKLNAVLAYVQKMRQPCKPERN